MEWYGVQRDGKWLARKTHSSLKDSFGLYWSADIQSARRYDSEGAAVRQAMRINGSMKVRKVVGLKVVA